MAGLPVVIGHAVEDFARLFLAKGDTPFGGGFLIPATQAVPAEARQVHEVDVLHLGAIFHEMLAQAAEGGGFEFDFGLAVHLSFLSAYAIRLCRI